MIASRVRADLATMSKRPISANATVLRDEIMLIRSPPARARDAHGRSHGCVASAPSKCRRNTRIFGDRLIAAWSTPPCQPFRGAGTAAIGLERVCTENLIRVDDVMESPKLAE